MMRLIDVVRARKPHRLVAPLMGYPGAQLTRSTLKQNGFNAELHYRSVYKLVEMKIVQVYLQDVQASVRVPRWKLVIFRPVDLQPDLTKTLRFCLSKKNLTFIDQDGNSRLEPGAFRLYIGGCSPDVRLSTASFAEMSFSLIDSTQLARRG